MGFVEELKKDLHKEREKERERKREGENRPYMKYFYNECCFYL